MNYVNFFNNYVTSEKTKRRTFRHDSSYLLQERAVIFKNRFLDTFFLLVYYPEKGEEYSYLQACVQNY